MVCILFVLVKRFLLFLKEGPRKFRQSSGIVAHISNILASFNCKLPSEFTRQPRTLLNIKKWKATEVRHFPLYTGLVLKENLLRDFNSPF